jgi:hypothetical protein
MRLIDADVLYKEVTEKYWDIVAGPYPFNVVACDMAQLVKQASTVDAVAVPCKMGDIVWGIKTYNNGAFRAKQGTVNEMYFGEDMRLCICLKNICRGEWGKNVFATKEEAEAEIERRKNES